MPTTLVGCSRQQLVPAILIFTSWASALDKCMPSHKSGRTTKKKQRGLEKRRGDVETDRVPQTDTRSCEMLANGAKRTPCVTFRLVVAPLRGSGQSPVLPFACCIRLLLSVGRCGRCWCRFRVRGAQWLVCWGYAECGKVCRLRVSGAQ